jgi:hypothetical protein
MKSKPKRNKAYRPKVVHIPVMAELQREFMLAGHGALAAMRLAPNEAAFDQLASLFNVFHVAMCQIGAASPVLESGMRALKEVAARDEQHGVLEIRRFELPPIENAVFECERLTREVDVMGLYTASLKTRALEQLSMRGALEAA